MKKLLSQMVTVLLSAACVFAARAAAPAGAESTAFSGKVVETMNAGGYTYMLVDTGAKKNWAATPQLQVKVGDKVDVKEAMEMANYRSKTLNRTFDVVYFSGSVAVNGKGGAASQGLPAGHPSINGPSAKAPAVDFSGLKKPAGGNSVEEVVSQKSKLRGKTVTLRGKVVKYNEGVMGKNWLHIRDGSGSEGSNDLTVTTSSPAKLGDTVLVKGAVSLDRDFGGGYRYPVIIEDAKVTVE